MIDLEDRQSLAHDIHTAHKAGARLRLACETAGIDVRTLQRWNAGEGLVSGDGRPHAVRPQPSHALSAAERAEVLRVANEPRFADMPPARIVPMLADQGVYIASESTFARVLREHGQTAHRGRAKAPKAGRPPTTHIACAPREVWCWDMTYLPAEVVGQWFYLYLILDLYSRKIVGWEVHEGDDATVDAGLTDIVEERYDAGVRFGDQIAKNMAAVPISPDIRMSIVGTPSYLSKHSPLKLPAGLSEHSCINTRFSSRAGVYAWELSKGKRKVQIRVDGPWTFNSTYLVLDAALSGAGLAYVPEQLAIPHLASGRLVSVLKDWCPTFPGLHIYYTSRQVSPALSLIVETLRHRR